MYTKNIDFTLTSGSSKHSGTKKEVVALFSDIRGFSNWCETQPLDNVADLMKIQFERVIQICNDHHHTFHKFLGDGFVLLWEPDEEITLSQCLAQAIDASFHLHKKYWYLSQELNYPTPPGYGVGISIGEAILIQPETFIKEMNEVDFVGYPLNCAARMQTLASGYGTVVCSATAQMLLDQGPSLQTKLVDPTTAIIKRAAQMKGLKPNDKTNFKYLSFMLGEEQLWRTSGIPDDA